MAQIVSGNQLKTPGNRKRFEKTGRLACFGGAAGLLIWPMVIGTAIAAIRRGATIQGGELVWCGRVTLAMIGANLAGIFMAASALLGLGGFDYWSMIGFLLNLVELCGVVSFVILGGVQ